MRYIILVFLLFNMLPVFGQVGDGGMFDPLLIEGTELNKYYTKQWTPPQFQDTTYHEQVLLLEDNHHLLEEIKQYEIITQNIVLVPERDSIIIHTPKEELLAVVDSIRSSGVFRQLEIDTNLKREPYFSFSVPMLSNLMEYLKTPIKTGLLEEGDRIAEYFAPKAPVWYPIKINNHCFSNTPTYQISWMKYQGYFAENGIDWKVEKVNEELVAKPVNPYFIFYKIVTKTHAPYIVETMKLPATIKTISWIRPKRKLKKSLQAKAVYSTITGKRIHQKGKWKDWRIVTCPNNLILRIQKALNEKGYPTPENNQLDKETKVSLTQFQKDYNIPIGNLGNEREFFRTLFGSDDYEDISRYFIQMF